MKKYIILISILLLRASVSYCAAYTIAQLADNALNPATTDTTLNKSRWFDHTTIDYKIYLYDSACIAPLSNDPVMEYTPQIEWNTLVLWYSHENNGYEIYLYDTSSLSQLLNELAPEHTYRPSQNQLADNHEYASNKIAWQEVNNDLYKRSADTAQNTNQYDSGSSYFDDHAIDCSDTDRNDDANKYLFELELTQEPQTNNHYYYDDYYSSSSSEIQCQATDTTDVDLNPYLFHNTGSSRPGYIAELGFGMAQALYSFMSYIFKLCFG